jgi:hypothetical protein
VSRRLPSPALVISVIALVVAVGGGAYAIGAAGNQTIKKIVNKQIAKRAPNLTVKHARTADSAASANSAKAADTAQLADSAKTAGSATTASAATNAQNLAPPEAVHLIGAPGEPAFENGAANGLTLSHKPAGFYKDRQCVVHLQGTVSAKSGGGLSSFTLPPAYRPSPWVLGAVAVLDTTAFAGYYEVTESGSVTLYAEAGTSPSVLYGLDGSNFRAATC